MARFSKQDSFGVEEMPTEELDAKQAELMKQCLCEDCPSYVAGDKPTAYCFPLFGTSKNIHMEKDCMCSTCPVFKEYELDHNHYCTRCSQYCQTYKANTICAGP
ncbi:MAG: DUF2769 domain-containing protein [Deltaproteobacteria bacterium]|nr:DUF2769 domain-containing protein [Deltaproteobacteria bacterium]